MNPPIREAAQQAPLLAALRDGLIDMISTDHAPHAVEEKYGKRIWDLACGFPGVETLAAADDDRGRRRPAVARALRRDLQRRARPRLRPLWPEGRDPPRRRCRSSPSSIPTRRQTLSRRGLHSRGKVSAYEGCAVARRADHDLRARQARRQGRRGGRRAGWGRMVRPEMPPPAPRNLNTTMRAVLEPGQRPWG